jgi:hypothetical protein
MDAKRNLDKNCIFFEDPVTRILKLRKKKGVQLGPLSTAATNSHILPAPSNYNDGELGGMMISWGNRSIRRKPAPVPLCQHKPHMPARTRTWAAAVASQRLTA